jgi:hypothetical protein
MATYSIQLDTSAPINVSTTVSGNGTTTAYTVPAGKVFWGTVLVRLTAIGGVKGPTNYTSTASCSIGGVSVASISSTGGGPSASSTDSFQLVGPGSAIVVSASNTGAPLIGTAIANVTIIGILISN